ncbi:uncharacterized protein A1O5_10783 [Cladophialophora psammophila CBS 110553]|uniref:4-coumarate-CoA ligase n=1 Tax=Cladophialophora psammophila CBS 110553 TaxID=1182543 RepID=W9WDH9_9EURO|nr:uncharacterized protein A1O5_10783 [Cladophialophora psammophila CBS 110553]EXJ66167.1 hypothetical protein A1O5_10783 [Cladophialophora psammophila CBS 110553]
MTQGATAQVVVSPYQLDIPTTDIASFVLSSGTASSRIQPQYFDATNPSKCFSLEQAETYVKQLAHGLRKILNPGDKVLLYSGNRLLFPVLLWGTVAAGCVFTAASPSASQNELEYQLRDSEASVLITEPENVSTSLKAAAAVGMLADRVFLFADPGEDLSRYRTLRTRSWLTIWSPVEEVGTWSWTKLRTLEEVKSTTAVINYSICATRTTGIPKGVELSHYNLVANSTQLVHKRSIVGAGASALAKKSRLDSSGERWLAPLPMYHAYGQTYYCMNAARIGAKVFIMPKFEVDEFLLYLDIYRITFMTAVPVVLNMLAKQQHPQKYNLNAIESVVTGSAPLNPEMGTLIERMYLKPGVTIKQGLGMTECTCSVAGFGPDEESDHKSVGWLNANCRARVVPIEDRDFSSSGPPGVFIGELWFSGPNVMKGYYKKAKETSGAIVHEQGHRWLRTGDVGYIDEKGHIYIVDRLKELIKVKGLQVAPAELELALLTHPDVADAAVVGAKINNEEYPRAFVVRKTDGKVKEEELKDLIKSRFALHKHLTGGVYFVDTIPRTGSGKVIRRALPNPGPVVRPTKL